MKLDVKIFLTVLVSVISLSFTVRPAFAFDQKPVVFFDMGDVIVDTHDMHDIHYFESSRKIISEVKNAGLKTGLIINIPANFGATCADKFQKLKSFIATSWRKNTPAFNWSDFNYIYLPPRDALRKPHPYLFVAAMTKACPNPMVFMGEDQSEVKAAADLGITSHWVGRTGDPEFLSMSEIINQTSTMPEHCDFKTQWAEMGIPQGFEGCFFE